MATIEKLDEHRGYESINRNMLQDNQLSLEARGLLSYMLSMPDNYIFYKTQLYKQFKHNKESSVRRIWKELLKNSYALEFRKRKGKMWDFKYFFTQEKYSESFIKRVIEEQEKQGYIWGLDFQDLKMETSKSSSNKLTIKMDDDDKYKQNQFEKIWQTYKARFISTQSYDVIRETDTRLSLEQLFDQHGAALLDECVMRVVAQDIPAGSVSKPLNYVRGILKKWNSAGLLTIGDVWLKDPYVGGEIQ